MYLVKQLLLCFLVAAIVRALAVLQYTVRRKLQRWLWLAAMIRDSGLEFMNKQDSLHQNNKNLFYRFYILKQIDNIYSVEDGKKLWIWDRHFDQIMFPGQFGEQNTGCGAFYRKTLDPGPPKLFRSLMWA